MTFGFTGYNPASQLLARTASNDAFAWTGAYAVSRPYSVNGLNQYIAAGPAAFAYDANGNLASDGSTSFVYDAENRLVSASGAKSASLAYDPLGRLWRVQGASATTLFFYDGDKLLLEYDGGGAPLRAYVHGPGTDEPIAWNEISGGGFRFLHADHQGSIVAVADSSGNPVATNTYDEYGIPGAGNQGRFGYTGQTWIPELGLWYYKARVYSPTLGRFLQTDPIGYQGGISLYAYVRDDPINRRDPTGLDSCPGKNAKCPNVALPAKAIRERARSAVGSQRSGERGGQVYANKKTGELRIPTGKQAGIARGNEFEHHLSTGPEERLILLSHSHPEGDTRSTGAAASEVRRDSNVPSDTDQGAMHQTGRAVQTIGRDVTTTLYRKDRQDYLRVDSGDAKMLNKSRMNDLGIKLDPPED